MSNSASPGKQARDGSHRGSGPACSSSELVPVGTHWEQAEQFAYNTDLGGRKP